MCVGRGGHHGSSPGSTIFFNQSSISSSVKQEKYTKSEFSKNAFIWHHFDIFFLTYLCVNLNVLVISLQIDFVLLTTCLVLINTIHRLMALML